MNYRKIYMKIINYAKTQNRKKGDGNYYECHHILPKSIYPLWKNRKSNLVLLTAREHFFVHLLLVKIFKNDKEKYKKMVYAVNKFTINPHNDYKISSKEYENIKKDLAIATSIQFKGKKQSEEWVKKRMISTKKTKSLKPQKWSESQRKKMEIYFKENKKELSEKKKNGWTKDVRKSFSEKKKKYIEENIEEWKIRQKNVCNTQKAKENMKNGKLGKIIVNNGIIAKYVFPNEIPDGFVKGRLVKDKIAP